ncbi:MAG: hypothetical protein RBU30_20405, partial [Polyangia bacterium]|nr:hypothetical protein [Polyangia bacterium]
HSFDADGRERWRWNRMVGTYPAIPAISSDGTLYVNVDRNILGSEVPSNSCGLDCGLYALDLDGNEKWFVPRSDYNFHHVAIGDYGTVFTIAEKQAFGHPPTILTLSPSGEVLNQFWAHESAIWQTNVGVADDGTVYTAARVRADTDETSNSGVLYALHPDGTLKWATEFEHCPTGGLAIDVTGAVYLTTYDRGGVEPFAIMGFEQDGAVRMSLSLGEILADGGEGVGEDFFTTSVVIADDGLIYVGSKNGKLHIIQDQSSLD